MSERWGDSRYDRESLDRWITRDNTTGETEMGLDIFHDQEQGIAGFYCNTTERPLDLELFRGDDPVTEMAAFQQAAELYFHVNDIRAVPPVALRAFQGNWYQGRQIQ